MKRLLACFTLFLASAAHGADAPYDEGADARQEIRKALAAAAEARVPVLVVFGANWCGDCKVLDRAMKEGASAPLIARQFKVVKVDVGKFDKNVDVAQSYGLPLKKGIPAVAILSARNEVVYATRGGELADARRMGDTGIYEFFKRVSAESKPKS
jgi:thioredoxin 1